MLPIQLIHNEPGLYVKRYPNLILSFLLLACLVNTNYASIQFVTLSDIHYGKNNSSEDGADSGDLLLTITMNKMRDLSRNADFILYLGDLPTHLGGYSPNKAGYEQTVFHSLFAANSFKKPMFYISGNNDPIAGDYQAFKSLGVTPLKYAKEWQGACLYCDDLIIDKTFMHEYGYYSAYPVRNNKDIILIVLNTTQWIRWHLFMPKYPNQDHDAQQQLAWLQKQLQQHHGKQVLIAMHAPPGNDFIGFPFWKSKYLTQFLSILENNQKNYGQMTLITSHTHMDEIRRIQFKNGSAIYGYSTPAISRIYLNNSGMKLFSLDEHLKVKDYTTYYTDNAKEWGNDHYHALEIFPNCQLKSLADCLDGLSKDEVCSKIEQGLFYGVKSPEVNNKSCRLIYQVPVN